MMAPVCCFIRYERVRCSWGVKSIGSSSLSFGTAIDKRLKLRYSKRFLHMAIVTWSIISVQIFTLLSELVLNDSSSQLFDPSTELRVLKLILQDQTFTRTSLKLNLARYQDLVRLIISNCDFLSNKIRGGFGNQSWVNYRIIFIVIGRLSCCSTLGLVSPQSTFVIADI